MIQQENAFATRAPRSDKYPAFTSCSPLWSSGRFTPFSSEVQGWQSQKGPTRPLTERRPRHRQGGGPAGDSASTEGGLCRTESLVSWSSPLNPCFHPFAIKHFFNGIPSGSAVKNPPASAGDAGSIPGSGRSPGGEDGNSLQCSLAGKSHEQRSLRGLHESTGS